MARVTVEDCVTRVPNRFDLVLLAARRARDISAGAQLSLDRDNDKNPVVALREIAEATVATESLGEEIIRAFQKHVEVDEPEAEMMELSATAEEMSQLAGEAASAKPAAEDDEGEEGDEDAELGLEAEDLGEEESIADEGEAVPSEDDSEAAGPEQE